MGGSANYGAGPYTFAARRPGTPFLLRPTTRDFPSAAVMSMCSFGLYSFLPCSSHHSFGAPLRPAIQVSEVNLQEVLS
jgi:hypothetical protein